MLLFAMLATTLSMRVIASDLYARRVPNRWLLGALLLGTLLLASPRRRAARCPAWPGPSASAHPCSRFPHHLP